MIRIAIATFCIAVISLPAAACIIWEDERSAFQIRQQSSAVEVTAQCAMTNGGVHDGYSLSAAQDLGNGRVLQRVNEQDFLVLLADCGTREATILRGPILSEQMTSCGPDFDFAPLAGEASVIAMTEGSDLHELVAIAEAAGAREINPISYFFEFSTDRDDRVHQVWSGDRFDLLCGCDLFYPDLPGGSL